MVLTKHTETLKGLFTQNLNFMNIKRNNRQKHRSLHAAAVVPSKTRQSNSAQNSDSENCVLAKISAGAAEVWQVSLRMTRGCSTHENAAC